jgi:Glycosyltransferase like family 2
VIATLDRLAALDYPQFEVLVIDNNTSDERLWQPVEAYCRRLGERFRFLHVEGIAGAKAGALNWAARFIDPRAELVAVVDADYHVAAEWLRATVGFFDDPTVGFVQPPHAYRDWQDRRFLRWANWEYSVFFATGMVALQEHRAGITVGTMSVIRKRALDDAGGWAEWCMTEDSELAIRIHALGYRSVYLTEPLGWGLIPETFASYRQQRFRWTYGPVQELRHHWKQFLPARLGGAERYSRSQRVHHANYGLDVAMVGVRLLAWPFAIAAAISLVTHHEHVPVPLPLWVASTVMLVSGLLIRWIRYCKVTGASLREAIGAVVAYQALTHTITIAALRAAIGLPAEWQRTDKFQPRAHRPLAATRTETGIGAALVGVAIIVFSLGRDGLALMLAIGLVLQALIYLSAPVVAAIAARDSTRTARDRLVLLPDADGVLTRLRAMTDLLPTPQSRRWSPTLDPEEVAAG